MKRIRGFWQKLKGPDGERIKWRFVIVAFLILAVSVSWAFRVNAIQNDQIKQANERQNEQIKTASIATDLAQCAAGNKGRKDTTDTLLYIAEKLDALRNDHETRDFVQDVIDKKLQPKDCQALVKNARRAGG